MIFEDGAVGACQQAFAFAAHLQLIGRRQAKHLCATQQAVPVLAPPYRLPLVHQQGFEHAITVGQAAIVGLEPGPHPPIAQHFRAHADSSARSSPRALARVSSSSDSATESITSPAPARSCTCVPAIQALRISMFRSMSPSRFR